MPGPLQQLIGHFGYLMVFLGTFLEGETVLLLGGIAARLHYLELPWVVACAFAGSLLGDQLWFWIGRRYGARVLARRTDWQPRVERIHRLLERFQLPALIGFRFVYGIRSLAPFVFGTSRIEPGKFLLFNIAGALLWAIAGALLGYAFAHAADALLGDIKRFELELFAVIIVLAFAFWAYRRLTRRRKAA